MQIVVEYSKEQNAFHRCTQAERDENEQRLKSEGKESSYFVVGIFRTIKSADKFIADNYNLIKNSRMFKNDKGELFAI